MIDTQYTCRMCTYLVATRFYHQGVWHQQSGFGFLNKGDGCHRDGDLNGKRSRAFESRTKQQRADMHFVVREPWCLCRRLWSGSRSSCRRQTSCPGTRCLSAERTCSLSAKTVTVSANSRVFEWGGGVKEDWLCRSGSSLLTPLNSLWYWALVLDSCLNDRETWVAGKQRLRGERRRSYVAGLGFFPFRLCLPVARTRSRGRRKSLCRFPPDKQKGSVFMFGAVEANAASAALQLREADRHIVNTNTSLPLLCHSCTTHSSGCWAKNTACTNTTSSTPTLYNFLSHGCLMWHHKGMILRTANSLFAIMD